ncbi:uncharacterized protein LOC128558349 [Mercenaria mercenaria]|uniref:uncharacterized protein LOC128558349 n=1 Tax=Mercenaria mercenaria TaxID=6596 RepID=UPI001E1D7ABC|nr:uncharacterized protein LOC128558349 [Mercenaria mercenaria]
MVKEHHLPVERVAKQFGIPITTLKDRIRGKTSVDVLKSGTPPLFSQEQEAFLSQHLITMAEIGFGYTRQETINLASDYAVHLGLREQDKPLSKQWFYNFLNRWPSIKVVKPRSLEMARARSATRPAIDQYFNELNKILTKYNLKDKPHCIYNIDEKGLSLEHKPPKIVTGTHYKPQAVTCGKSKTVTVIGGGNAVGNQVPPFFVFPGVRMLPGLLEGCTSGTSGTVSESGWSNTEVFTKYMTEHLEPHLPSRADGSKVLVLYDGHRSHVSLGLIEWAQKNGIVLFVLPPHCSHLLQPLDVSCYGPFEIAWNHACHQHLRQSGGCLITRFDVCKIGCKAYTSSLSASNIQSAFKHCGVYPFNPNVVPDSALAPASVFRPAPDTTENHEQEQALAVDDCNTDARLFLEKRGGEILKHVPVKKVRNTLSKVVSGKPITEQIVYEKIKEHVKSNAKPSLKKKQTAPGKRVVAADKKKTNLKKTHTVTEPIPSTSGIQAAQTEYSSSSESEDDTDVCCICQKFHPEELKNCISLTIVSWACCDKCNGWVHLGFCSPVRVIRRGDSFLCPKCTGTEE